MMQASNLFSEEQRKQVERCVVEAEAKTSCEIVPVIASESGRYDRPEDIIGLWFVGLSVITLWIVFPRQQDEPGSWNAIPLYMELLTLMIASVTAFGVGVVAGNRILSLRRLFTPQRQMQEEVARRAREVFFDNRVHHTSGATGLLIYVSLFERIAVVLGDQQILEHSRLGQPFLDRLCQQLTDGLRQRGPTEAICGVVAEAGGELSGPWPRAIDDVNELHDSLVLLD